MYVGAKVQRGVFRIQQVRQSDSGVYVCEAENSEGTAFATVTIDIESTHRYAASYYTDEIRNKYCPIIFTARCYTERGYARVCRLSVCLSVRPSVTFRYTVIT